MRGLYLHRRFFLCLWIGVFALILAFVFPGLYPWVIWGLTCLGFAWVLDVILLYGYGQALEAWRVVGAKFSNGEDNPVRIQVRSSYPFTVRLRILDELPAEFQLRTLALRFRLPPRGQQGVGYSLRPVKRGSYRFGQIRVFVTSCLSLVERRYSFAKEEEVAVYPSFIAMRKYELLAFASRQSGSGGKKMRVPGISTAFDQIKPYVQGDDPRSVNWKATAKCRRLMVNAYTEERSQQVYCLIDKGRSMQAPFEGMTTLDYAINATLALSNVILKKGDKAGLLTFANRIDSLLKADNRSLQLNRINEALYSQQTHFLESDFELLCTTVSRHVHTRSLLILFTNFDTVSGMKRRLPALKRLADNHLLLLILFENTEIRDVAAEPVSRMRDLYLKVLAGSFVSEKNRIAGELRGVGIYTILTEPRELTLQVINGYLEMKERGLI